MRRDRERNYEKELKNSAELLKEGPHSGTVASTVADRKIFCYGSQSSHSNLRH